MLFLQTNTEYRCAAECALFMFPISSHRIVKRYVLTAQDVIKLIIFVSLETFSYETGILFLQVGGADKYSY